MPSPAALCITFALFLLAPFFRKWIDLVVWPKLQDWWAERSYRTTKTQIEYLEHELNAPREFNECIVAALRKAFMGLYFLSAYVVALPFIIAIGVQSPGTKSYAYLELFFKNHPGLNVPMLITGSIAILIPAAFFRLAYYELRQLRYRNREKKWKTKTEARIAHLRAKLETMELKVQ